MEAREKKKQTLAQGCAIFIVLYMILSMALYFIAGEQFQSRVSEKSITSVDATTPVGEILKGDIIEQIFLMESDILSSISLKFATYGRQNTGTVEVQLIDNDSNNILFTQTLDVSSFMDNSFITLRPEEPIKDMKEKTVRIAVSSETGTPGNAVTIWYNADIQNPGQKLYIKGEPAQGTLCFSVEERDPLFFGKHYFLIMGSIGLLLTAYCIRIVQCQKTGKKCYGLVLISTIEKYRFLLQQLVSRDFKTKYKRSALGVLWSFLNPLLTMAVQYIVFSTIFKSNIPNFAVYLLVGIVFFNFFSEATGMGLMSIVGNSSLITKVYIPKYIFPVSRVLSSAINLLLSLIPLILVVAITGVRFTYAFLLLPFSLICAVIFCIGMSFILSAAMVYFRDMQFLWGVISMLWMYATPIFYPETILPQNLMVLFKLNPMYHFIRFSRAIILNGASPEPQAYLLCLIAAFVPLAIGTAVFKKSQNGFVLHI